MSEHVVFKGGWLDIPGLLRGLAGSPLQAETEEVCISETGSIRRRTGRVLVDRQRRLRLDVEEEGHPTIMFLHDPTQRVVVCGVADRPETWGRVPWAPSLPALREAPTMPAADLTIVVEFSNDDGAHRYRLFNAKYEDPDASLFPRD
jgi:hypothetical protein